MTKNSEKRNLIAGLIMAAILCCGCVVIGVILGLRSGMVQQEQTVSATQVMQSALDKPEDLLSIEKIQDATTLRGCDVANCGSDFSEFKITNVSSINIELACSQNNPCGNGDCEVEFGIAIDQHLAPGDSTNLYCANEETISPPDVCFAYYPEQDYANQLGRWCFDGRTHQFLLEGSDPAQRAAATATALWSDNIVVELHLGPHGDKGTTALLGSITNTTGKKLTLLDGVDTPLGAQYCYGDSGSNDINPGKSINFYCDTMMYKDGYGINDLESACLTFYTEQEEYIEVCKPVKH